MQKYHQLLSNGSLSQNGVPFVGTEDFSCWHTWGGKLEFGHEAFVFLVRFEVNADKIHEESSSLASKYSNYFQCIWYVLIAPRASILRVHLAKLLWCFIDPFWNRTRTPLRNRLFVFFIVNVVSCTYSKLVLNVFLCMFFVSYSNESEHPHLKDFPPPPRNGSPNRYPFCKWLNH